MANKSVWLPKPFADIARSQLMYPHATPVEPMRNLSRVLNAGKHKGPKFWIKHEDTNSPLAYGGNKVRKLEYVIADAVAQGATHLVTVGGIQSNSQRQVAAAGNRYGLRTVLTPDPTIGNPSTNDRAAYESAGNVQINAILGAAWKPSTPADGEHAKADHDLAYEVAARREMKRLEKAGSKPYFIPSGASLHPLGGLGFARWAFELDQQESEMGLWWDVVIVSCASGSTLGGMLAGFKLLEKERDSGSGSATSTRKRKLIGMQATTAHLDETRRVVLESAKNTTGLIGLRENYVGSDGFEVNTRFNGGAYGRLDDKTREGIKLLAETEGILTDPVYTGKAITGLITLAREGEFDDVENVLFVHTGGSPALGAYPSMR